MNQSIIPLILQRIMAAVAVVFGIVTIIAGSRVLTGTDPGYTVFQPLLVYNTLMGVVYIAGGLMIWRNLRRGKYVAASIFTLNLIVLGGIAYLYFVSDGVAVDSLRAMTLRTVVWLVLLLGSVWLGRGKA